MATYDLVKQEYDESATTYNDYVDLPLGILESQLLTIAIGDCTNLTVLDLGGGTGLRARQVLDVGAKSVDVVDLSPEMMKVGKAAEEFV